METVVGRNVEALGFLAAAINRNNSLDPGIKKYLVLSKIMSIEHVSYLEMLERLSLGEL